MRLAIVGSRKYPYLDEVTHFVNSLPPDTVIISDHAKGVDLAAEKAAEARGLETIIFPVTHEQYLRYGNGAFKMRNRDIVDACDLMVAFWHQENILRMQALKRNPRRATLMQLHFMRFVLDRALRRANERQDVLEF